MNQPESEQGPQSKEQSESGEVPSYDSIPKWRLHELLILRDISKLAGVPLEFTLEAEEYWLIKINNKKIGAAYYRILASWLKKLSALREAGLSWEEIWYWTRRRFTFQHRDERQWPKGYEHLGKQQSYRV